MLLPQNAICPHFPELWDERHLLMAYFARSAAEEVGATGGSDVAMIVGAEHIDPIAEHLEGDVESGMEQQVVSMLLDPEPTPSDEARREEGEGGLAVRLEKRAAMAAFLLSTQVTPHPPKLCAVLLAVRARAHR